MGCGTSLRSAAALGYASDLENDGGGEGRDTWHASGEGSSEGAGKADGGETGGGEAGGGE